MQISRYDGLVAQFHQCGGSQPVMELNTLSLIESHRDRVLGILRVLSQTIPRTTPAIAMNNPASQQA